MIDATQLYLHLFENLVEAGEEAAKGNGWHDPNADIDGDGIANWKDDDNDGDVVSDQNDNYPADPTKTICDCGRGRGIAFGTSVAMNVLPTIVSGVSTSARAARVTLGPVMTGQTRTLAIVF